MKRNLINSLVATFITAALALGSLTACSVDDLLGRRITRVRTGAFN